jgi:hypothetical protein
MIHIDKLQLGQIVQKWEKLAKNWDKLVGTNLTWDKLTRHHYDYIYIARSNKMYVRFFKVLHNYEALRICPLYLHLE